MSGCQKCGAPCGHYRRCQTHRLAARHDDDPRPDGGNNPEDVTMECANCGTEYDRPYQDSCPDCGETRRRYVGPLEPGSESDYDTAELRDGETPDASSHADVTNEILRRSSDEDLRAAGIDPESVPGRSQDDDPQGGDGA